MKKPPFAARCCVLSAAILLLIPQAGCISDIGPVIPPPAPCKASCRMKVYLLRGLWDFFSVGLNRVTDRLREQGIDATVISGTEWLSLVPEIVARRDAGEDAGPLVFVGHSFGADEAVMLARELVLYDVRVDRIILLESTLPPLVPSNVDLLIHYYQPTFFGDWFPDTFAGNPVLAEPDNNHTDLRNIIISTRIQPLLGENEYLNYSEHFYADENPAVQTMLANDVVQSCPGAPRLCGGTESGIAAEEPSE